MDKFVVNGRGELHGKIAISGSKNCALPTLFATLLSPERHRIRRVPKLQDMDSTFKMLSHLGSAIDISGDHEQVWHVDSSKVVMVDAPYDLVRKMRASVLCLGPLLARFGEARVSLPGGCAIGARPIDLHLMALEKMGATITQEAGYVSARLGSGISTLKGAQIHFPVVSVGATENALMAATLANGLSEFSNAAFEPEVADLCQALNSMGAKIQNHNNGCYTVHGQSKLGAMDFEIPPDRIETATYLIATHLCGGKVELERARAHDLDFVLTKLREAGAKIKESKGSLFVESDGIINPVDISTAPYPGFPTDVQAQWVALMSQANGRSLVTETIFENRFMHVPELVRMGAKLSISDGSVIIEGKAKSLSGAPVMATDLRASASLVLAALCANGESSVKRIYHLDRGYEEMEVKLSKLGANVKRLRDT